ncbi:hypothetical protein ABW21_db0202661 [Orbilia brochopaga]|nr:hypothetical protein ABW21_db0202661 [Drechslerella brochopaga]
MISIKGPSASEAPSKANILPCRIKYTGPASSSRHLWNPLSKKAQEGDDSATPVETHTAYFRGRKLTGTKLVIPEGYQGRVLSPPASTDKPLTGHQKREILIQDDENSGDEDQEIQETAQWASNSIFSEIMVWGHEVPVDGTQDGVVKGIEEWMEISKHLNGYGV